MLNSLSMFGFKALWSPYVLLSTIVVICFYYLMITRWREKFEGSNAVGIKQQIYFGIGIIGLYLMIGGPIDLMGHLLFSAHMAQMAILFLVVPPLLLLGLPDWFLRWVLSFKKIDQMVHFFSKPLIALFVFNGLFSIYHLPAIFDVVKMNALYHNLVTGVLFCSAVMMWWSVFNPLQEKQTMKPITKIGYIFANGMIITPACALIIFAKTPFYGTYTDPLIWGKAMELCVSPEFFKTLNLSGPYFFGGITAVEDQQIGGVVMKILQEIIYSTVIGYIFFGWVKAEKESGENLVSPYVPEDFHEKTV